MVVNGDIGFPSNNRIREVSNIADLEIQIAHHKLHVLLNSSMDFLLCGFFLSQLNTCNSTTRNGNTATYLSLNHQLHASILAHHSVEAGLEVF